MRGNKYIFILYNYDDNAILQVPLKDRTAANLTNEWNIAHERSTNNGHTYNLHILDNEISAEFIAVLVKEKINYQLAPPGNHRTNSAERAIYTFKHHLLSGLASCHRNFPIREWDHILNQAKLTLNLLRHSMINPNLCDGGGELLHVELRLRRRATRLTE